MTKIEWAELRRGNRLMTTGGYIIVHNEFPEVTL